MLGFALVIVTNQSGIGRGFYSDQEFHLLMSKLTEQLASHGLVVHYFYCPHAPSTKGQALCSCRKPLPGLFYQAQEQLQLDLNRSLMVGDKLSDLQAAAAAGVPVRYLFCSEPAMAASAELITEQFNGLNAITYQTISGHFKN